mgnify:CR=1 FL=1
MSTTYSTEATPKQVQFLLSLWKQLNEVVVDTQDPASNWSGDDAQTIKADDLLSKTLVELDKPVVTKFVNSEKIVLSTVEVIGFAEGAESIAKSEISTAIDVLKRLLERVARGRRALLVGAVCEHLVARGPCEQNRDAGEIRIFHNLSKPEPRLVIARIKAVHIHQHIAVHADAPGDLHRNLGFEGLLVEITLAGKYEMGCLVRAPERGLLDHPRLMARRDADGAHKKPRILGEVAALGPLGLRLAGRHHKKRNKRAGRLSWNSNTRLYHWNIW